MGLGSEVLGSESLSKYRVEGIGGFESFCCIAILSTA